MKVLCYFEPYHCRLLILFAADICGPGYELQANSVTCLECPIGTVKLAGDTICTVCPDSFTTDVSTAPANRQCVRKWFLFFGFDDIQQGLVWHLSQSPIMPSIYFSLFVKSHSKPDNTNYWG